MRTWIFKVMLAQWFFVGIPLWAQTQVSMKAIQAVDCQQVTGETELMSQPTSIEILEDSADRLTLQFQLSYGRCLSHQYMKAPLKDYGYTIWKMTQEGQYDESFTPGITLQLLDEQNLLVTLDLDKQKLFLDQSKAEMMMAFAPEAYKVSFFWQLELTKTGHGSLFSFWK